MAEQELLGILCLKVSSDPTDQQRALSYIDQASRENFPEFVKQLATILANPQNVAFARQVAGLQLNDVLILNEGGRKILDQQRWDSLPEDIKNHVKQFIIQTLGTESRPSSATQCIAAIASAEIPNRQWLNVIDILKANVTTPESSELLKESSLETIGYIFQSLPPSFMEPLANKVLNAIVVGMREAEGSMYVKLAATGALYNLLKATYDNFQNETERNSIMEHVCRVVSTGSAANQNVHERLLALENKRRFSVRTIPLGKHRSVKGNLKWVSSQSGYWGSICTAIALGMDNSLERDFWIGAAIFLGIFTIVPYFILYCTK
jgi:importin subunit beta-1